MAWIRQACWVAALILAGIVAACSSSPTQVAPPAPGIAADGAISTPAAATAGTDGSPADPSGYTLGPGDEIRVTVFRHEDLSGEFELDGRGTFAMPLVGEMDANTLTARQLEDRIEGELSEQGYLVSPQVSVEILNYRPFYIIGEVRNPGSYPYVSGMTVINAVALAGGFTYRASESGVTITRGGSNGSELATRPESEVLPGDIIRVPERFF